MTRYLDEKRHGVTFRHLREQAASLAADLRKIIEDEVDRVLDQRKQPEAEPA
jgi:hypothetical protein